MRLQADQAVDMSVNSMPDVPNWCLCSHGAMSIQHAGIFSGSIQPADNCDHQQAASKND
jgi:hypothetical protein